MTLSLTTPSIMPLGITTFSITINKTRHSAQLSNTMAQGVVMLSVREMLSMLSAVMLNVFMLSVVMLKVIMLSIVMLNVIMLSVVTLKVIRLSAVMLNVYAECHYAECCYAECLGAICLTFECDYIAKILARIKHSSLACQSCHRRRQKGL
jgi:hypothetical protein